jgi:hypothetical protein
MFQNIIHVQFGEPRDVQSPQFVLKTISLLIFLITFPVPRRKPQFSPSMEGLYIHLLSENPSLRMHSDI